MQVFNFCQIGKREYQEDCLFISPDLKIFSVCDGVGGSCDGHKASNMVVINLLNQYTFRKGIEDMDSFKRYIFEVINVLKSDTGEEIATTITLLCLVGSKAYLYHIGDSKIFYISPKKQKWFVTKDHSFVQELFEAGILSSEEDMRKHPLRNRITKALTSTKETLIDEIEIETINELLPGDMFVLCSDGALENFTNLELVKHFTSETNSIENLWNKYENICRDKSKDNNTAILIRV